MTLDEVARIVMDTYAPGCMPDDLDRAAARAVLLAVADYLEPPSIDGTTIDHVSFERRNALRKAADELRRIAGEG